MSPVSVQQQHQSIHPQSQQNHNHHLHSVSFQQQQQVHAPSQAMYTGNGISQLAGRVVPEFFGYTGGNEYAAQQMQTMSASSEAPSPPQDLNASWYNFMAQFR